MLRTMRAHLATWLRGLGIWTLVALVFMTQGYLTRVAAGEPITIARQALGELFTFLPWVILWPFVLAAVRRFPLEGPRRLAHLPVLLAAGALVSGAHVIIGVTAASFARPEPITATGLAASIVATLPRAFGAPLAVYAALVAVFHADAWRRASEARALRQSQLEATLVRAELGLLRMQLHPHFLFNTLHSVSALMARDVPGARRMLAGLSELLRLSLESDGGERVALAREIAYLEHYITIQKMRFPDRLHVDVRLTDGAGSAQVPRLLLQPIVENAIRHGLEPRTAPVEIVIGAERRGDRLRLSIDDDGAGLPAGRPLREGVGLGNTRARLAKIYGDAHDFTIAERPGGGVSVTIALPFTTAAEPLEDAEA
jgi:two-component system, LytTR family, sensor kinase